jgi:hypothetical protein
VSNASRCSNIRTRRFLSNEDCHFDNPWLGRRIGLTLPGCIGDVGPTIRRTSGPERTRRSGPAVAPSPPAHRGCWRPDRQCAERCRPSGRADPRSGRAAEGAGHGPSWRGRAPPAAAGSMLPPQRRGTTVSPVTSRVSDRRAATGAAPAPSTSCLARSPSSRSN